MGKKKLKHLGRYKKVKKNIKIYIKKIGITICVLVSVNVLFNISNYIENINKTKDISLEQSKVDFIDKIEKGAKKSYRKYGIFPSVTIAQAILESGWGESQLTKDSNNLFGIKADSSWDGEYVEVITSENYNDKVNAKFRKYNDLNESIEDHAKFLAENKRYGEHGIFQAKNYKQQAEALQDAGYSTKKNEKGQLIYAEILINIIESYNLYLLDNKL
ncbi:glycoside hydrolase family 73 protein [Romboutsia sp.]|uniref:glycoside hydrolase family 73 protein n=1 Tax=Romboutsia sp. TaxID=1965302 RepID=UPI002BAAD5B6|nr:glycoside hydrolase family 73 protein [Romboutsia sp.]HSQ90017.1 glycoside hydrolase family 73 protein [Romboutsia sp.]